MAFRCFHQSISRKFFYLFLFGFITYIGQSQSFDPIDYSVSNNLFSSRFTSSTEPFSLPIQEGQSAMQDMPSIDPSTYRLGAGDTIEVHVIIGDNVLHLDYVFTLAPGGLIFFPNLGEMALEGKLIEEAKKEMIRLIRKRYNQSITVSLLLTRPRKISIFLTGYVNHPGWMSVWNGTRLSSIDKSILPGGSLRFMTVYRQGKSFTLDSIAFQSGGITADILLMQEDMIEIPLRKKMVTLLGAVSRPGYYEIQDNERISDVLNMAGSVGAQSALSQVIFLKRTPHADVFVTEKLNLYDILQDPHHSQNKPLQHGDILTIPSIESYVYVQGNVARAGRYDYVPGKKISDYINMAGGPLEKADLGGVTVARPHDTETQFIAVNLYNILRLGKWDQDIEINGGDVITLPGNFFYVNDFLGLSNIVMTFVALYNVLAK